MNDSLTNLPGSIELEADIADAIAEAKEQDNPFVLTMLDLDHFSKVNAQSGHQAGDEMLKAITEHLVQMVPENTNIYRIGGDSFAMLSLGADKESVFLQVEAIRSGCNVKASDDVKITMSIGIASYPDDGVRLQELQRKADGAMYRAKTTGRNRVCLAREEKMVTKTSHYTTDQLQRLAKLAKQENIGEAILLREALDMLLRKYDM